MFVVLRLVEAIEMSLDVCPLLSRCTSWVVKMTLPEVDVIHRLKLGK